MHHLVQRFVILSIVLSLFTGGCILSKSVDRSYIGFTQGPKYPDRKVKGFVLLPIAAAADIVTSPIQAVLLMIYGDGFPFDRENYMAELDADILFQKLSDEQKSVARAELESLVRSSALSADWGLVLCGDGHWVSVNLNPEARAKLIARANSAAPERLSLARAH